MKREKFLEIWNTWKPMMRIEEALEIVEIVERRKPKIIMEIGTGRGGSFKLWEEILPENGVLIGIDWHDFPQWSLKQSKRKIFWRLSDSHKKETVEKIAKFLGKEKIDFLFIDATHTMEAVQKDFESYLPFMSKKGIVAFHDIRRPETPRYKPTTAGAFYRKLKKKYKTKDILPLGEWPGSDGIGVVYLNETKD